MNLSKLKRLPILLSMPLFIYGAIFSNGKALAETAKSNPAEDRYGLGMILGKSYKPVNDIDFYMLSWFGLYDHKKLWPHIAPDPMRFKVEFNIGAAEKDGTRFMTSLNAFALYYVDLFKDNYIRPYIEAGIGVIYTGFQVKGQGLRINFNPQLGAGTEFKTKSGDAYFLCIRHHHISNGGLDKDNRGINSFILMGGLFF